MDSFYFNEELECHCCGYRFFVAEGRVIQFPTFCPECGEVEVYQAQWEYDDEEMEPPFNDMNFGETGERNLMRFD